MSEQKSIKYNRVVGIQGDEIYVLEDAFQYAPSFKGVTGYGMTLLLPTQVQNYIDNPEDYYRELWKEAVRTDNTEESLQDFCERCWSDDQTCGSVYPGDDPSFRDDFYDLLWTLHEHEPAKFRLIAEWWAEQLDLDVDEFMELYEENAGYEPSDFWEELGLFDCTGCGRHFDHGMEFDVVIDPEMVTVINEWEEPKVEDR